jgi:hypothetical protein
VLWGTVENLAPPNPPACDAAAATRIKSSAGELRRREVFITFGGPQGHADRLANLRRIGKSASTRRPRYNNQSPHVRRFDTDKTDTGCRVHYFAAD